MPAGRTRVWDTVCANPTSRAPTVSAVHLGSMALAAKVCAAPSLSHPEVPCTNSPLTDQLVLSLQPASAPALG